MAGTVVLTADHSVGAVRGIVITATGDATDGSFPATTLGSLLAGKGGPPLSGRLLAIATNPGATAPQANYDIALNDGDGLDRLQNLAQNRHTSNSEHAAIVYSGTSLHPPIHAGETLSLAITNNNVVSAVTVITLFILQG